MAAKGAILKQEIAKKILSIFPNSFLYNDGKELRINGEENGEMLQIKLAMTTAKVAVENGSDTVMPGTKTVADGGAKKVAGNGEILQFPGATGANNVPDELTEDEKTRLTTLLTELGL